MSIGFRWCSRQSSSPSGPARVGPCTSWTPSNSSNQYQIAITATLAGKLMDID